LVVSVGEGGVLTPAAARLDRESNGVVRRTVAQVQFSGKKGKLVELLALRELGASRIFLAGIGKPAEFDAAAAEDLGAAVVKRLMTSGEQAVSLMIDLPPAAVKKTSKRGRAGKIGISGAELAAHIALGASLRSYRFDHYRSVQKNDRPTLKEVKIVTRAVARAKSLWSELSAVADGAMLARDLVNEPPNVLYPAEFAKRARALTKLGVKVEVLSEAQMKKLGMNTLLAVGQGSAQASQLVVMRWSGAKKGKSESRTAGPVAFVGKGVCFDSGGLSLKPANTMAGMKGDMGGAAAVVGLMHALAKRKASVDAVGVVGLVENMPDGMAMRPDDVVTTMSGQTVEVLNTDAEGRLMLADAIAYAVETLSPTVIVDVATLTGAAALGLGRRHAALYSTSDGLAGALVDAGEAAGERLWRMPLVDDYRESLESTVADVAHIETWKMGGGSITAALFLERFAREVPWAHVDIAGPGRADADEHEVVKGGTAFGTRALLYWLVTAAIPSPVRGG
jgi:leucyl aminopeptidase